MSPPSDPQNPVVPTDSVSAWLGSLVGNLIQPTALLGRDLNFCAVSESWANGFVGWPGSSVHTVCPAFPARWEELFPAEATQASPTSPEAMLFQRADGTTEVNHWKAALWRAPDGTPCGAIVTLGLGAAAEAPVPSPESPVDAASVGKATRRLAHDFNNIFTVINGGAEWLSTQYGSALPAGASELLQSIKASGGRGIGITRKLLALGRNQSLEPTQIDLVKALAPALADVSANAPRGVKCVIKLDTQQSCQVLLDARQLQNALAELARNAFEAMPNGGTLSISLQINGKASNCVLTIEDTGCGIPSNLTADVITPLFTTKGTSYHGLGLAIAHDFVVRSGGTFEIISSEGTGCRIVITLPLRAWQWA